MKITAEEMKGTEFGLMTRTIRSLIEGMHDVEITIDGKTVTVTDEVSEFRRRLGEPLNGDYKTVYETTKENVFLLVEINKWCNVVRAIICDADAVRADFFTYVED